MPCSLQTSNNQYAYFRLFTRVNQTNYSRFISFGALIARTVMEILKPETSAKLFLNWQLLIIVTTIESAIFYFIEQPRYSILVCLAINLLIVFMPAAIHTIIENKLKSLHLEVFYDKIRGKIINFICRAYLTASRYLMSFLNEKEKTVFKEMMTTYLKGDYSQPIPYSGVVEIPKTYDEKGSQCAILQAQVVGPPISMTYNLPSVPLIPADLAPMTNSVNLNRPVRDGPMDAFKKVPKSPDNLLDRYKAPSPAVKQSDIKTQSNYKIIESFAPAQQTVKNEPRKSSTDAALQEYNVLNQRSGKLIDQLNMSVSQYSDMLDFDEDKPDAKPQIGRQSATLLKQDRPKLSTTTRSQKRVDIVPSKLKDIDQQLPALGKPIIKVQAYVQMGSKTYPRLQKYFVQLHPNNTMQIVSMHGRVFERHQLRAMKRQQNDYFQMQFGENETPNSRVVKFKTDMGDFSRYIR